MGTVTDKIRIVGAFGEAVADKVKEFVKGLEGVESVSVLRDGIETYPEADSVKAAQDTDGEQANEATPETAAPAEQTA
jgi:hypothetical protein